MTDLISAITEHFPSMLPEVCLCAPPADGSLDQPGLVDDHLGSGLSRCGTFGAQNGNNRLFLIRKFFFRLCQIVNDFHVDVGLGNSSGLIFLFPSLYGEGYSAVNVLLKGQNVEDWGQVMSRSLFYGHNQLLILYIALVTFTKVFATSATNGSGGCGGTFAPSLIIGGFAGFLFARLWNVNQVGVYVPEQNFTLMGMAGLITGVMHAPLTGIFLIAELTGGYQLFMPLMIVCISSLLTISIFESHSIYALRLAREGKLLTHHVDRSALTLMSMQSMVEKDYHPISPDLPMSKLVSEISRSNNNFVPVLDDAGVLKGVIDITRLRHIIFRTELYNHFKVSQLMIQPSATLGENERMDEVMDKFDKTDAAQLPVVDVNGVLKGYISRTKIYEVYRKIVADMSAE